MLGVSPGISKEPTAAYKSTDKQEGEKVTHQKKSSRFIIKRFSGSVSV